MYEGVPQLFYYIAAGTAGALGLVALAIHLRARANGAVSRAQFTDGLLLLIVLLALPVYSVAAPTLQILLMPVLWGTLGLLFGRRWARRETQGDRPAGADRSR